MTMGGLHIYIHIPTKHFYTDPHLDINPLTPATYTEVNFWGICDIKYDPRNRKGERIRVLELGDGRSSCFSHHGRYIKEKFDSRQKDGGIFGGHQQT